MNVYEINSIAITIKVESFEGQISAFLKETTLSYGHKEMFSMFPFRK